MPRVIAFALSVALLLLVASATHADPTLAGANRTWKRVSEFSLEEKVLIDWREETPRSAEIPYLPAEPYPFEAPFTAEELGYRRMSFTHNARWPHTMADSMGSITKAGYLSQRATVLRAGIFSDEQGVPGHLFTAPGKEYMRIFYYFTYPPSREGMQGMWIYRRTDKAQKTKFDSFLYSPSLRRVRRLPQPRRDTPLPGAAQSADDILTRDAWEFTWRIVGADVLYETVRFPVTRPVLTLTRADGTSYDVDTADIKIMGDAYPFYAAKGGVECHVLVAEPRPDWLPDYAVSRIVYWLDKHYSYPLRIEQYDSQDRLLSIQVRLAKQENPALGRDGYANLLTLYWDPRVDLMNYSLHDAHRIIEWTDDEKVVMFSPDFMRRRWLKYRQRTQASVDSPEQFYLRPSLEPEKWPEERPIHLAPDVEARIRAQDAVGHLVFSGSEETQANGDEPS
jgi:hypothetical protein